MQGSIYIKSSAKASHMFSGTSLRVMLQSLWLSLAAGLSPHGPMEPVSQVSSIRYSRDVVSYPTTTCQRMSTLAHWGSPFIIFQGMKEGRSSLRLKHLSQTEQKPC